MLLYIKPQWHPNSLRHPNTVLEDVGGKTDKEQEAPRQSHWKMCKQCGKILMLPLEIDAIFQASVDEFLVNATMRAGGSYSISESRFNLDSTYFKVPKEDNLWDSWVDKHTKMNKDVVLELMSAYASIDEFWVKLVRVTLDSVDEIVTWFDDSRIVFSTINLALSNELQLLSCKVSSADCCIRSQSQKF